MERAPKTGIQMTTGVFYILAGAPFIVIMLVSIIVSEAPPNALHLCIAGVTMLCMGIGAVTRRKMFFTVCFTVYCVGALIQILDFLDIFTNGLTALDGYVLLRLFAMVFLIVLLLIVCFVKKLRFVRYIWYIAGVAMCASLTLYFRHMFITGQNPFETGKYLVLTLCSLVDLTAFFFVGGWCASIAAPPRKPQYAQLTMPTLPVSSPAPAPLKEPEPAEKTPLTAEELAELANQLTRYKQLLDEGAITKEEYDDIKRRIMDM